jgi:type VI protein secretion system component VasF
MSSEEHGAFFRYVQARDEWVAKTSAQIASLPECAEPDHAGATDAETLERLDRREEWNVRILAAGLGLVVVLIYLGAGALAYRRLT